MEATTAHHVGKLLVLLGQFYLTLTLSMSPCMLTFLSLHGLCPESMIANWRWLAMTGPKARISQLVPYYFSSRCCASSLATYFYHLGAFHRCWRKQLVVVKDARRVDILCQRLSLAQRLLEGTVCYREQHEIVDKAAKKLEEEIGPLAEAASRCVRGIVSRLSYGLDVQQLAREALEAADLLQVPSENSDGVSQGTPFSHLYLCFESKIMVRGRGLCDNFHVLTVCCNM